MLDMAVLATLDRHLVRVAMKTQLAGYMLVNLLMACQAGFAHGKSSWFAVTFDAPARATQFCQASVAGMQISRSPELREFPPRDG